MTASCDAVSGGFYVPPDEHKFDFLDIKIEGDAPVLDTKCRNCGQEFVANTRLLLPENVEHEIGKSVKIICPACKTSELVTAGDHGAVVEQLIRTFVAFRIEVEEKLISDFKFKGSDPDAQGNMSIQCTTCKANFTANPATATNMTVMTPGEVTGSFAEVVCPACGLKEKLTPEKLIRRVEFAAVLTHIDVILSALKQRQQQQSLLGQN